MVQAQKFCYEIATFKKLSGQTPIFSKNSPLYTLDPFLDDDNLLWVGGRIRRAILPNDIKHPLKLPKHNHVTNRQISHFHVESGHSGRGMTLNAIRQAGFWILRARSAVTKLLIECITCHKLRGWACVQSVADLPEDRLDPVPPVTNSAVDYFGPFHIKEKRLQLKRWEIQFTCLASRAIPLETAIYLTTDSFINAYRLFVDRRGPMKELRSDIGNNFVGGRN